MRDAGPEGRAAAIRIAGIVDQGRRGASPFDRIGLAHAAAPRRSAIRIDAKPSP